MTLYTTSKGILSKESQISICFQAPLILLGNNTKIENDAICVGWGQKNNTRQIKKKAQELGLPYWQLEDGFIGYIGHPAKGGKAVSLIADPIGIYYCLLYTSPSPRD